MRWLRDYGWIALVLAGIFACGFVAGRRSAPRSVAAQAIRLDDGRWETSAFDVLNRELALSDAQRVKARAALVESSARLRQVRDAALSDTQGILIDLIDHISPDLDPGQRKILDKDRLRLQRNLIQNDDSADGVYPFRKNSKSPRNP
jgi:hypothetical protein